MTTADIGVNSSTPVVSHHTQGNELDEHLSVSDIDNIWLLPDGVNDLFSNEAQKQEWLRYQLTEILVGRGYELICPPMIEFTESLLGNASEDLKRQTFKIIDQISGRLMGVRADITPQILRIDAHLTKLGRADTIARYCYAGHVIRTLPNGLFGSRTPLQLGAEIFGCDGLDADIELMDVLYRLLASLNLNQQLHMDIGHVAIFARLKVLAGLSDYQADTLISLYANKALPELKQVSDRLPMGEDFYQIAVQGHDMEALKRTLSDTAKNDTVITEAIEDVRALAGYIKDKYNGNVSVDITELGYHYHTGIVFNGYFSDDSQAVVRGGRFNGSLDNTSENAQTRSATGFSLEVTRLQQRITLPIARLVVVDYNDLQHMRYTKADTSNDANMSIDNKNKLKQAVAKLRNNGDRVIFPLEINDVPQATTHRLIYQDSDWVLQPV